MLQEAGFDYWTILWHCRISAEEQGGVHWVPVHIILSPSLTTSYDDLHKRSLYIFFMKRIKKKPLSKGIPKVSKYFLGVNWSINWSKLIYSAMRLLLLATGRFLLHFISSTITWKIHQSILWRLTFACQPEVLTCQRNFGANFVSQYQCTEMRLNASGCAVPLYTSSSKYPRPVPWLRKIASYRTIDQKECGVQS